MSARRGGHGRAIAGRDLNTRSAEPINTHPSRSLTPPARTWTTSGRRLLELEATQGGPPDSGQRSHRSAATSVRMSAWVIRRVERGPTRSHRAPGDGRASTPTGSPEGVHGGSAGAIPQRPGRLGPHCTEQEDNAAEVERQVQKSAAALLLASRIRAQFDAIVTGASEKGTGVRIREPSVEWKVVRGSQGLDVGDHVRVELVDTDVERG